MSKTSPIGNPSHANQVASPSSLDAIVPYGNGPAMAGYYCAVFSLIPGVGIILALAAVPLGVIGLHITRDEPQRKGHIHAWIAIILGTFAAVGQIVLLYWLIFSALPEINQYT